MPAFDESFPRLLRCGPATSAPLRACAITSTVFLVTYWIVNLSGWFAVIGVSVLTTYQHHAIDVLAGFMLAVMVIAVTSPRSAASTAAPVSRHHVARSA